jgi:hypothetical protein
MKQGTARGNSGAGTKAADEGADWLRVDIWTTNKRLQHYYLCRGFTYGRAGANTEPTTGANTEPTRGSESLTG